MSASPPEDLVGAMLEPGFFGGSASRVELRETHISWVFLVGDLAYKVKKPLRLPFLDYSSLERRHAMCREEVRLNRRLAPEIYRGVVAIVPAGTGYALAREDAEDAVEYAVEMLRIPEERTLAALIGRDAALDAEIAAVARLLARFHLSAPPVVQRDELGIFRETLEENHATLGSACGSLIAPESLDSAHRYSRAALAARGADLEARAAAGLVRDCHGDLRAEHVVLPDGGAPYVFDCIEFEPALREIDVVADLAFLVMDLSALGAERLASRLVDEYRRAGGDPGDDALIDFFAAYRALVRAKVVCLRRDELDRDDPRRAAAERQALSYFRLAERFAWRSRRPVVIVVCGVAGTGKSTLARELAARSGLSHLSSDEVRKRLAGIAPTERAGDAHYTPRFTERTYRELGARARAERDLGGGAIVDATFHRAAERDTFRAALGAGGGPVLFVECEAPRAVLFDRLRRRAARGGSVSDAGVEVAERQLAAREPLAEVAPRDRIVVDTTASLDSQVAAVARLADSRVSFGRRS